MPYVCPQHGELKTCTITLILGNYGPNIAHRPPSRHKMNCSGRIRFRRMQNEIRCRMTPVPRKRTVRCKNPHARVAQIGIRLRVASNETFTLASTSSSQSSTSALGSLIPHKPSNTNPPGSSEPCWASPLCNGDITDGDTINFGDGGADAPF